MASEDVDYYRQRAAEERAAMATAADAAIAKIHAEMARHYEELIRQVDQSTGPDLAPV